MCLIFIHFPWAKGPKVRDVFWDSPEMRVGEKHVTPMEIHHFICRLYIHGRQTQKSPNWGLHTDYFQSAHFFGAMLCPGLCPSLSLRRALVSNTNRLGSLTHVAARPGAACAAWRISDIGGSMKKQHMGMGQKL